MNLIGKHLLQGGGGTLNGLCTINFGGAGVGKKWLIFGWTMSFSGGAVTPPVLAQVTVNGVTIGRGVSSIRPWDVMLVNPWESEDNGNPSFSLGAGGVGVSSNVWGFGIIVPNIPAGIKY